MSEAMRLADWCEKHSSGIYRPSADAAAELRRLSAVEQELEALKRAISEAEPVAAQHRFRHPQKPMPNWAPWHSCKVSNRPAWEIDSQGYEVEYRALYTHPAPQAKPQPLSSDRDARIAELERELEKEKQYVKEMTKDRDHWMTVAAERALLLDKNRKVSKPLSDYEFDEIG